MKFHSLNDHNAVEQGVLIGLGFPKFITELADNAKTNFSQEFALRRIQADRICGSTSFFSLGGYYSTAVKPFKILRDTLKRSIVIDGNTVNRCAIATIIDII